MSRKTGTFLYKTGRGQYAVKLADRENIPGTVKRRVHMSCDVKAINEKAAKAEALKYFKQECQKQIDYYTELMQDINDIEQERPKNARYAMPSGPEFEDYISHPERGTIFDQPGQ